MWLLSRYLQHWRRKNFWNLQIRATKQEQICQLEDYGLTGKWPFVTSGFSIYYPDTIYTTVFQLFIKRMKTKRNGSITRILHVEHKSFTSLVFSCFRGINRECSRFFSHTAERLANRRKEPKSKISAWIKARLKFEACCCVFMEQKYPQTLIISAKLICVPLLLREISNESLTDSFHITSWS